MSSDNEFRFDWEREQRTGLQEVVFAQGKSIEQLVALSEQAIDRGSALFMTRVSADKGQKLINRFGQQVSYHALARCLTVYPAKPEARYDQGIGSGTRASAPSTQADLLSPSVKENTAEKLPAKSQSEQAACVGIVAAGTSDAPLVAEIEQCLGFFSIASRSYIDVGVAGLWRLLDIKDELDSHPVLIAVAGMEGALFSVLSGLVASPVIAVPSAVGYGVSSGGQVALNSALASCSPGLAVVNIDNGFGAAALARKMLALRQWN